MNEMKYILEELTSVDEFKDIEEMARLTKKIQKENEQTHYLPNLLHMGYQGFKLPDYDDYCDYIFSLVNEKDAKVFFARETCCSKKIIGACVGALQVRCLMEFVVVGFFSFGFILIIENLHLQTICIKKCGDGLIRKNVPTSLSHLKHGKKIFSNTL